MFPREQKDEQTLLNCIIVGATAGALKAQAAANEDISATEMLLTMVVGACVGATAGIIIGGFQYLEDILSGQGTLLGQLEIDVSEYNE